MSFRIAHLKGFSLVEVVLAVGIVAFALLAIFGLFGSALRSNAETLSQQEVLGLTRSFPSALAGPEVGAGFSNVYAWVRGNPDAAPEILAFLDEEGLCRFGLATDTDFQTAAAARPGRMFRLVVGLSPNMPLRRADGTWVERLSPADLPADPSAFSEHARLPLQVKVYDVGAIGAPIGERLPVLTYETSIDRF